MIARTENAPKRWRSGVRLLPVLLLVLLSLAGCKKRKPKPFPPAPPLVSTATTVGAAMGPSDAGLEAVPMMTGTPASLPAPADTTSPQDRAALESTSTAVADLDAMVKKGVLTNPDKPDDDAAAKCTNIEESRTRIEALDPEVHPEAKQLAADAKRLCTFEVPVLGADHTLKQVTNSPSQASRQLMCKYAQKDIDKARAARPGDRKVRDLEGRFARSCK